MFSEQFQRQYGGTKLIETLSDSIVLKTMLGLVQISTMNWLFIYEFQNEAAYRNHKCLQAKADKDCTCSYKQAFEQNIKP